MCAVGVVVFGLLTMAAGLRVASSSSVAGLLISGVLAVGFAVLTGYTAASLRVRTILDGSGVTAIEAFRRIRVPWARVTRLDVTHSLPGWAARAWSPEGEAVVVFTCHDTHGKRPKSARTFNEPPPEAPASLQRGFALIERYWQAAAPAGRSSAGPAGDAPRSTQ
jgi:hypothetical protein